MQYAMQYAPTTDEAFPDGIDVTTDECRECGGEIYLPERRTRSAGYRADRCEECYRDRLTRRFRTAETHNNRVRALDELDRHGFLPVRDDDGRLVVEAQTEHVGNGFGWELRRIVRLGPITDIDLTEHDTCPECDYRDARYRSWTAPAGVERGEAVICAACEAVLSDKHSL